MGGHHKHRGAPCFLPSANPERREVRRRRPPGCKSQRLFCDSAVRRALGTIPSRRADCRPRSQTRFSTRSPAPRPGTVRGSERLNMQETLTVESLRAAVEKAGAELDSARERYAEILRLGHGQSMRSDGTITLNEARLLHADARRRLKSALARFSGFVFSGR